MLAEYECKVLSIKNYVDNGKTIYKVIKLEKPKGFNYEAGQFAMLAHPELKNKNAPENPLWRPFSIASSPLQDFLEFCILIKPTGGLTQFLEEHLKEGDCLLVEGPFGIYRLNEAFNKVVFIATGSGITPFMSMLRTLFIKGTNKKLQLFYGFRNANQFLYREELESYNRQYSNFEFYCAASNDPEWPGFKGYVNPLLSEHAMKGGDVHYYICGSPVARESITKHLLTLGVSEENIHIERWV